MGRAPCAVLFLALGGLLAQEKEAPKEQPKGVKINWQKGPMKARLGDQATMDIPEKYVFLDKPDLPPFYEATQNFLSGTELGIAGPETLEWFVIFRFEDTGYVKDDEKDKLDADALYKSMDEGNREANEERKKRGWGEVKLLGWVSKPHYDQSTHNLEWGLKVGGAQGPPTVNHNTRYLGRKGVMSVKLLVDEGDLTAVMPRFQELTKGFSYTPENHYKAWVKGDKVAEYGLGALVLGGAAAAAAKTGLLKSLGKMVIAFWKIIALAFVGLFGAIKKLFSSRKPVDPVTAAEPTEPPAAQV